MTDPLQQELTALDQFIALLQREQKALVAADVQALLPLTEDKLKLSEQLNALARARGAALAQAGYAADANGVRQWLAGQPRAIAAAWGKLLDKAHTAQRLNETNGKLINTHLQHNQQALTALMNASNQSSVYGPDGQPRIGSAPAQRIIGKV